MNNLVITPSSSEMPPHAPQAVATTISLSQLLYLISKLTHSFRLSWLITSATFLGDPSHRLVPDHRHRSPLFTWPLITNQREMSPDSDLQSAHHLQVTRRSVTCNGLPPVPVPVLRVPDLRDILQMRNALRPTSVRNPVAINEPFYVFLCYLMCSRGAGAGLERRSRHGSGPPGGGHAGNGGGRGQSPAESARHDGGPWSATSQTGGRISQGRDEAQASQGRN